MNQCIKRESYLGINFHDLLYLGMTYQFRVIFRSHIYVGKIQQPNPKLVQTLTWGQL